jgi:U4/U6.U5 small nuclear ribonucleoproteins
VKEQQPEAKMAIDTKEPVTSEDVTEEDMMAMMGFAGFGTTKVSLSLVLLGFNGIPTHLFTGSSCGRKSGRCCQDQPATDMAPVYEQVRIASCSIFTAYRLICRKGGFNRPLEKVK